MVSSESVPSDTTALAAAEAFHAAHTAYVEAAMRATVSYLETPLELRGPASIVDQHPDVVAAQAALTAAEFAYYALCGYRPEDVSLHPLSLAMQDTASEDI